MRYCDIRGDIKMELSRQGKDAAWLAHKTGYEEHQIQQWLAGSREPKVSALVRMLSALQMRLEVKHTLEEKRRCSTRRIS